MTDDELLEILDSQPFRFWRCPDPAHRNTGTVTWKGERATCDVCGQTNHPLDIPGIHTVLVVCAGGSNHFLAWAGGLPADRLFQECQRCDIGKTKYWYAGTKEQIRGLDVDKTAYLLLDYVSPRPELRQALRSRGYQPLAIPRQWRVYSWEAGCIVKINQSVMRGVSLAPENDLAVVEEESPDNMRNFLSGQIMLPHTGLFGLTPEAGSQRVPEEQVMGWFRQNQSEQPLPAPYQPPQSHSPQ